MSAANVPPKQTNQSPNQPSRPAKKAQMSTARIFRLAVLIVGFAIIAFVLFNQILPS
ncbi:hypothetical protein [uncultured Moraxella sp.]|uniref:hypothetical protein n=1 Tax=uncultured Moraxella sp. TaxID=263769 RepID=UPI0025FE5AD5|nr:hypothetical protein [uncultured Moraxella sp.]